MGVKDVKFLHFSEYEAAMSHLSGLCTSFSQKRASVTFLLPALLNI